MITLLPFFHFSNLICCSYSFYNYLVAREWTEWNDDTVYNLTNYCNEISNKNTLLRFNNLYNWRFFNNIKIYGYPFFRGLSKQNEIGRAASGCSLSRRPVYIKRIHTFLLIKLNINIQFWTGGHVIERLTLRIFYYIKCFGHNGNSLSNLMPVALASTPHETLGFHYDFGKRC